MLLRRTFVLIAACVLAAAACGGDDDDDVATATVSETNAASPSASASETVTTESETPTAEDTEASTAPATATSAPTTPPTQAPVLDEDTLDFLRQGLWSVPESDTRCGFDGAFGAVSGTLTVEYQDPSDDGDFYVICYTTIAPPPPGTLLAVRDPSGTVVGNATVTPSGAPEQVSGFQVDPLVLLTDSNQLVYNGIARTEGDRHVTQVHLWLPHNRREGLWRVQMENASGAVNVSAPCSTGSPADRDPLVFPTDIDFLRHGGGSVTRHCLGFVDVVGDDLDTAATRIDELSDARGATDPVEIDVDQICNNAHAAGIVVAQFPPAGDFPIFPFRLTDQIEATLDVSTGPCQAQTPEALEIAPY